MATIFEKIRRWTPTFSVKICNYDMYSLTCVHSLHLCRNRQPIPERILRGKYVMDDLVWPKSPVAPLSERFSGGALRLLAIWGFIMLCGLSNLRAQGTTHNAQETEHPDPCSSPTNEKLTPFEDLLLDQVENAVLTNPSEAPDIVVEAIATDVSNPLNFPGHVIQRAVRALGQKVNQANMARIVFGAVRARPDAVLETVRASIQRIRAPLHPNIVAAAVAALGDPYLRVELITIEEYFRETLQVSRQPILWDRIRCIQGAQETVEEVALGYKTTSLPEAVTLAEAIIDSAIEAGSSESSFDLQRAVDLVLQNGLGLSSLEGNPADSSTLLTVPPPIKPTPTPGTPGTPTPTPPTPTPTPSPISP
jgi:hypothetical protein